MVGSVPGGGGEPLATLEAVAASGDVSASPANVALVVCKKFLRVLEFFFVLLSSFIVVQYPLFQPVDVI